MILSIRLFFGLGFLSLAGFALYYTGAVRFNYPNEDYYSILGLDVSHHQGVIDWAHIPTQRYTFVYMKATEGGDFGDKNFEQNWAQARKAGLRVGAYHFFTMCRPGDEQAQNFIDVVPMEPDSLPPVVDLEFVGNCSRRPTHSEFSEELRRYISRVSAIYEVRPLLYTTYGFYDRYLRGTEFEAYDYWIRDIFGEPDTELMPSWIIWQYADNARVEGIDTKVDLNAINPESTWFNSFDP